MHQSHIGDGIAPFPWVERGVNGHLVRRRGKRVQSLFFEENPLPLGRCEADVTSKNGTSPIACFTRRLLLRYLSGLSSVIIAERGTAEGFCHLGAGFSRADPGWFLAGAPVKIIFDPGLASHRRIPSFRARGRLLLIRLELGPQFDPRYTQPPAPRCTPLSGFPARG